MRTLSYSCILEADPTDVCAFHTDTRNLPLITPPWIDITIVSMDQPPREGSHIELRIKRFGIPTTWVMTIARLDCPHTLTDEMIRGPFRTFRHERFFEPLEKSRTRMNETITMEMGWGILDRVIFPLIRRDMEAMFAYRHRATQHYLKEHGHVLSV